MAERILCERRNEKFTGLPYWTPYDGNCLYVDDRNRYQYQNGKMVNVLQEFKKDVLKEHPELKGSLKIMTVEAMDKSWDEVCEVRDNDPAYKEWLRYRGGLA